LKTQADIHETPGPYRLSQSGLHLPELLYQNFALGGFYNLHSLPETVRRHTTGRPYAYAVTSTEVIAIGKAGFRYGSGRLSPSHYCRFLAEYMPGATVLVITRGFASMKRSFYRQSILEGYGGTFPDILSRQDQRDRNLLDYDRLISEYREAFGPEHVIMLPFELLQEDSDRFLAILQEKLGLREPFANPGKINETKPDTHLYWIRQLNRLLLASRPMWGEKRFRDFYNRYTRQVKEGGLNTLFSWLARLFPNRRLVAGPVPQAHLKSCKGLAESLRPLELYRAYHADYLWEAPPGDTGSLSFPSKAGTA
jgi:hypothetical protein